MKKVEITRTCDLPGEHDQGIVIETVPFSYQGDHYEIDLCGPHKEGIERDLGLFISFASPVPHQPVKQQPRRTTNHRKRARDIREWAKENGKSISDRGRIPAPVIEQYEAAKRQVAAR